MDWNLRPVTFERDNIFIRLVQFVYKNDTPTNVLPSIHVYIHLLPLWQSKKQACPETKRLGMGHWYSDGSDYFSYCILKQHSMFDGVCALALYVVTDKLCYGVNPETERSKVRNQLI